MICRICESKMIIYEKLSNIASNVSILYKKPTVNDGYIILLYKCPVCGHYQIESLINNDYYNEYLMSVSHSQKIQNLQSEQVKILEDFSKQQQNFFEIGCGDGAFLSKMQLCFEHSIGIEPSKVFYKICREKDLYVLNEYLTERTLLPRVYDAFAARQVFEHLDNPVQVLKNARDFLNSQGVGLIEVPNAVKMLSQKRYFDLFTDHINYFTPSSLCRLAAVCGFEVIMVRESFNGDYLELYIRKSMNDQKCLANKREKDLDFVLNVISEYNKVSIWGAGAKAQAVFTVYGTKLKVHRIFDSDFNKCGFYLINSNKVVEVPSKSNINESDLIIILAVSYEDEIIHQLRNEYQYSGDILCLEGEPRIIKYNS